MRVLVLDPGGSRSALAGVRALGMAGLSVGVASPVRGMAARSRWCSRHVPSVDVDGFDVVVPAGDAEAFLVSERRDSLSMRVPYAAHDVVARSFDKAALAEVARSVGVAVPAEGGGNLPVVVKGRSHVAGRHEAVVARTEAELSEALAAVDEAVVQEFVEGDLVALSVVADESCRVVARVQQRALAVWPSPAGVSTRAETVPVEPTLSDAVDALVTALGWIGLAQFQFIVGRDGVARLIDCNGRLYGSLWLAVRAGVNLPAIWLGAASPSEARVGVRYQWLEGDLRRGDVLGALRFAVGAQHSVSSLRDPMPAVFYAGELARRAVRKARR